jgi:hypothetical protein
LTRLSKERLLDLPFPRELELPQTFWSNQVRCGCGGLDRAIGLRSAIWRAVERSGGCGPQFFLGFKAVLITTYPSIPSIPSTPSTLKRRKK